MRYCLIDGSQNEGLILQHAMEGCRLHSGRNCQLQAACPEMQFTNHPCLYSFRWAHGVVVSHPLRMRKALGSNLSVSIFQNFCAILKPYPVLACMCLSFGVALQDLRDMATMAPKANRSCQQTQATDICKGKQMGTWCSGITPA